jgi:hypothetical protein
MAESNDNLISRLTTLENNVEKILRLLQQGGGGGGGSSGGANSVTVTKADWQGLSDKLDRFEETLSPKEKAMMLTILGAAAAAYGQAGIQESVSTQDRSLLKVSGDLQRVRLSDGLKSIGKFGGATVGGFGDNNPAADSIGVGGDFTSVHGDWSKDLGKLGPDAGIWNSINVTQPGSLGGNLAQGGAFGRSGNLGGGFR